MFMFGSMAFQRTAWHVRVAAGSGLLIDKELSAPVRAAELVSSSTVGRRSSPNVVRLQIAQLSPSRRQAPLRTAEPPLRVGREESCKTNTFHRRCAASPRSGSPPASRFAATAARCTERSGSSCGGTSACYQKLPKRIRTSRTDPAPSRLAVPKHPDNETCSSRHWKNVAETIVVCPPSLPHLVTARNYSIGAPSKCEVV